MIIYSFIFRYKTPKIDAVCGSIEKGIRLGEIT